MKTKVLVMIACALHMLVSFASAELTKKSNYVMNSIKVKEKNAIGRHEQVEKTVLVNSDTGQVWLFVGKPDDRNVTLVPVNMEGFKYKAETKNRGNNGR